MTIYSQLLADRYLFIVFYFLNVILARKKEELIQYFAFCFHKKNRFSEIMYIDFNILPPQY